MDHVVDVIRVLGKAFACRHLCNFPGCRCVYKCQCIADVLCRLLCCRGALMSITLLASGFVIGAF